MAFRPRLSRQAQRYLERADADQRRRLAAVLEDMSVNPYGGDVRPLKGRPGQWRRRVGDLRIIFRVQEELQVVDIAVIGPRGDVY